MATAKFIPGLKTQGFLWQEDYKLNWGIVNKIRKEFVETEITRKELALKYNVGYSTIRDIIYGRMWKTEFGVIKQTIKKTTC